MRKAARTFTSMTASNVATGRSSIATSGAPIPAFCSKSRGQSSSRRQLTSRLKERKAHIENHIDPPKLIHSSLEQRNYRLLVAHISSDSEDVLRCFGRLSLKAELLRVVELGLSSTGENDFVACFGESFRGGSTDTYQAQRRYELVRGGRTVGSCRREQREGREGERRARFNRRKGGRERERAHHWILR